MWKGLLPIGSIVRLVDGDRRLMIVGMCVSKEDDLTKVYDYSAVLYPEGFEDPDSLYMFNAKNIERVYSVGYMDEETAGFMPKVDAALKELRKQLSAAKDEQ